MIFPGANPLFCFVIMEPGMPRVKNLSLFPSRMPPAGFPKTKNQETPGECEGANTGFRYRGDKRGGKAHGVGVKAVGGIIALSHHRIERDEVARAGCGPCSQ